MENFKLTQTLESLIFFNDLCSESTQSFGRDLCNSNKGVEFLLCVLVIISLASNANPDSPWHTPDTPAPDLLIQLHVHPHICCSHGFLGKLPYLLYGLWSLLLEGAAMKPLVKIDGVLSGHHLFLPTLGIFHHFRNRLPLNSNTKLRVRINSEVERGTTWLKNGAQNPTLCPVVLIYVSLGRSFWSYAKVTIYWAHKLPDSTFVRSVHWASGVIGTLPQVSLPLRRNLPVTTYLLPFTARVRKQITSSSPEIEKSYRLIYETTVTVCQRAKLRRPPPIHRKPPYKMLALHCCFAPLLLPKTTLSSNSSRQVNYSFPCLTVTLPKRNYRRTKRDFVTYASKKSAKNTQLENEEDEVEDIDFNQDFVEYRSEFSSSSEFSGSNVQKDYGRGPELDVILDVLDPENAISKDLEGFKSRYASSRELRESNEQKAHDRDPELAEILSSSLLDPKDAGSKIEERFRSKRDKMVQTKMGSAKPMNVTFNKFDFSNSYIWFELYNIPLEKDISLLCDTIRAWFVIGRLGGCNSMNMQLSQSNFDKRPQYDAIQGANMTPSTFYNIGDLEIQENLGRVWVDIGTSDPLLLDVLINALTQISSDFVGIKQVVFGGSEFEKWKENLKSEDAGCSVHKI